LLIIVIVALPWAPELMPKLASISTATAIAEGTLLLGLSFWLGIPFDRFADTLSERVERHNRLQFALNIAIGRELPAQKPKPNERKLVEDIYAENRLRLEGLKGEDGVVSWLDYHRSRIRLARALAVYGPALTLSLTVGVSRSLKETPVSVNCFWLSAVAAGYFVWAILASPPRALGRRVSKSRVLRAVFTVPLPRTDESEFIGYVKNWNRVNENGTVASNNYGDLRVWFGEWRILAIPLSVLVSALWLGFENGATTATVAWMGAVLTVLSTWSWWRISFTYRSYLRELDASKSDRDRC
jgi:hypothetical protein